MFQRARIERAPEEGLDTTSGWFPNEEAQREQTGELSAPESETPLLEALGLSEASGDVWFEEGGGSISGPEPPTDIPSWYQHQSAASESGDRKALIYFGTDQDSLTADDRAVIAEIIKQWGNELQSGDWELDVRGFCDERADDDYNDDLSARRAQRVLEELRAGLPGMSPEDGRLSAQGEIPSSSHPDDLARNRRVEIHIKRKERARFPLPNMNEPQPGVPQWQPPEEWSAEWELYVDGSASADIPGLGVAGVETVLLTFKNLKTGEMTSFTYLGGSVGRSLAPVGFGGAGGPYPIHLSKAVPASVFAEGYVLHAQLGAVSSNEILQSLEDFGVDVPPGYSGDLWVFRGPMTVGAGTVVTGGHGGQSGSPNAGGSLSVGGLVAR